MSVSGTSIFAAQYVAVQNKAESLLGIGAGSNGYGQPLSSTDVVIGNTITKTQWDQLKFDIINIRLHQDGDVPNIVEVAVGDVIQGSGATPVLNYDILLNQAILNKFALATNQSVVTAKVSQTYTTAWSNNLSAVLICVFTSANEARHFFNSGGRIRFTTSLVGGSVSQQVVAWKDIFNIAGTQSFGADVSVLPPIQILGYYNLTNAYQTYFTIKPSGLYGYRQGGNSYRLEARCNVPNNNSGLATQVEFRITLDDVYVDPDPVGGSQYPPSDTVNGTLTISVDELKAAGNLVPSGNFTIISPSYSLSAITGS